MPTQWQKERSAKEKLHLKYFQVMQWMKYSLWIGQNARTCGNLALVLRLPPSFVKIDAGMWQFLECFQTKPLFQHWRGTFHASMAPSSSRADCSNADILTRTEKHKIIIQLFLFPFHWQSYCLLHPTNIISNKKIFIENGMAVEGEGGELTLT